MKILDYIKNTKSEMRHVSWPNKKETTNYTILVIAISIAVGILLGVFDYIYSLGLKDFILR